MWSAPSRECGLVVHRVQPPYTELAPLTATTDRRPPLRRGTIFAISVQKPEADWPRIFELAPRLRSRFPSAPVILRLEQPADANAVHLARRAGAAHIRAVLLEREPMAATLRPILSRPAALSHEVIDWLRVRGTPLSPAIEHVVQEIFNAAARHRHVDELALSSGRSQRTLRDWFRACRLPGPAQWAAAARALHAALALQGAPDQSLFATALDHGYGDHAALSHQLQRVFGVRSTDIRAALGWEWLLDRWLTRAGEAGRIRTRDQIGKKLPDSDIATAGSRR